MKEDGQFLVSLSGGPARQSLRGAEIHGQRSCQGSNEPANYSESAVYYRRFQPAGKVCAVGEPWARQCLPLSDPQPNQGIELRGRVPGPGRELSGILVETSMSQQHGQLKAAVEDRHGVPMAPKRAVGRYGESTFSNDWRKRGLGCARAHGFAHWLGTKANISASICSNQRHPDNDLAAEDVDRGGSISKKLLESGNK